MRQEREGQRTRLTTCTATDWKIYTTVNATMQRVRRAMPLCGSDGARRCSLRWTVRYEGDRAPFSTDISKDERRRASCAVRREPELGPLPTALKSDGAIGRGDRQVRIRYACAECKRVQLQGRPRYGACLPYDSTAVLTRQYSPGFVHGGRPVERAT
ncbi:MAG: hypothetical protein ACLTZY_02150 [Alistipes indistinctus]